MNAKVAAYPRIKNPFFFVWLGMPHSFYRSSETESDFLHGRFDRVRGDQASDPAPVPESRLRYSMVHQIWNWTSKFGKS